MRKGKILVPRDYQERIVAYIEKMGNNAFTARDCATEIGIPIASVAMSLVRRFRSEELDRILVGRAYRYATKDDPKIMCVPKGLVAELVWATLKDASSEEELTRPEIERRIEAKYVKRFLPGTISSSISVWHRLGFLLREGTHRYYRYRLTDAARALPERPVISKRLPVPETQTVQ